MTNTDDTQRAKAHTPEPWTKEYLPYVSSISSGTETEIPCYRIHPSDTPEEYICETNEHLDGAIQEAYARCICAAVNACEGISTEALEQGVVAELLNTLTDFFNIMHDYESSIEKGYVQQAMERSGAAIEQATGRAA